MKTDTEDSLKSPKTNESMPVEEAASLSIQKIDKKLGVIDGARFLFAYVVGAGIFTTVADVHDKTGKFEYTILMWVFCGALCMFGALS